MELFRCHHTEIVEGVDGLGTERFQREVCVDEVLPFLIGNVH